MTLKYAGDKLLYDYQEKTIVELDEYLEKKPGSPCIVLPPAAGKSHVIAWFCKFKLEKKYNSSILILTHAKELVEQNSAKMRGIWKNAPMGIYSAGVGKKQLGYPITFASIQSIIKAKDKIDGFDYCIIDECHLINHEEEGIYRELINHLKNKNDKLRIIGLSATPFRLGHGLITDKPALFDDFIEPITIGELIERGFLAKLKSKITKNKYFANELKKIDRVFVSDDSRLEIDKKADDYQIINEVLSIAEDRKSWLFFCSGVEHAENISRILKEKGISSICITGKTRKKERTKAIENFRKGEIKALTNANVLTTGFDAPNIDLIVFLRHTMSPALYVQMAGRGLRLKEHTDNCLVLDFAGVVETHGPIVNVSAPKKRKSKAGDAPVKPCPVCFELVSLSSRLCPECKFEFPKTEKKPFYLRQDDILGIEGKEIKIKSWLWQEHISHTSGKRMLKVRYYSVNYGEEVITEYFPVTHSGPIGTKAINAINNMARNSRIDFNIKLFDDPCFELNKLNPPLYIEYRKAGKFYKVLDRKWHY